MGGAKNINLMAGGGGGGRARGAGSVPRGGNGADPFWAGGTALGPGLFTSPAAVGQAYIDAPSHPPA